MERQTVQYKWKIIAWNALRKDDKNFDQKRVCDFKRKPLV